MSKFRTRRGPVVGGVKMPKRARGANAPIGAHLPKGVGIPRGGIRKPRGAKGANAPIGAALAKRKKPRSPAQIAATKRMLAAKAAKQGKATRKKSSARKSSTTRRKPRGKGTFGGAVRVKRPGKRAVTIVAPHRSSGGRPCARCGQYHDLRQHWSHKSSPHNRLTRTEHSYLCERYGVCPPKKKAVKKTKKKAVRRKKKVEKTMTREQCRMLICRQKYAKRAKRR